MSQELSTVGQDVAVVSTVHVTLYLNLAYIIPHMLRE